MAISEGSKILASDIEAKNLSFVTFETSGKPDKTIGNDDQSWEIPIKYFQNTTLGNLRWYYNNNAEEQYFLHIYTDSAYSNRVFAWKSENSSPYVNTNNWDYTYESDADSSRLYDYNVKIPTGSELYIKMEYKDLPLKSRPAHGWNLALKQAQTGISAGEYIRVWNDTWSDFEPQFTTEVTAVLGNAGRLGAS